MIDPAQPSFEYWYPVPPPQQSTAENRVRVATAAVLNLSGLGLGYALMRRWVAFAVSLVATGILLLIALPVGPKGISGGVVVLYLVVLVIAAVHAAVYASRNPPRWLQRSWVAAVLAVLLLAVPAGGAVLYNRAQANAVQDMLLKRLKDADNVMASAQAQSFANAQPTYDVALAAYHDLLVSHRDSRAGRQVPARLAAFYQTVAAAYTDGEYCVAIAPLTYLRTVPAKIGGGDLGSLAAWPDDRLATSLYECGTYSLTAMDGTDTATSDFNTLMTTFPTSAQAGRVAPAVASEIDAVAVGLTGADPCATTTKLRTLDTQIAKLNSSDAGVAAALSKDHTTATSDIESGVFACGEDQFKKGAYTDAQTTMRNFSSTYPNDPNNALAGKIVIAAEVALKEPDAGKQLPTLAAGGSATITITNDSPDALHVLYTGSATGSVDVGACAKCSVYSSAQVAKQNACTSLVIDYPHATISVPPGTVYVLDQSTGKGTPAPVITDQAAAGESHDYCAYESSLLGSYLPAPIVPSPVTG